MSDPTGQIPDVVVSAPLSPTARRVLTLLTLQALEHLPHRLSFTFPVPVLALAAPDGALGQALQTLAQTVFSWSGPQGETEWGAGALLAHAGIAQDQCCYAFSPLMGQMLAHSPGRARLQLAIQRHVSSGHALALYELCAPWTGAGRTPWWPVEQVRAALGLAGSAYYAEFKHFNAKILKPSALDLAGSSDLCITPRIRRAGRHVARLRFDVARTAAFAEHGAEHGTDSAGVSVAAMRSLLACEGQGAVDALRAPQGQISLHDRAARLAAIDRVVARRTRAQRETDKLAFLSHVHDPTDRSDFERFAWMSARNADAIWRFWQQRAPHDVAFAH